MKLCTAAQMQALDRRTIDEIGVPGIVLMENASRGAVDHLGKCWPDLARARVAVLCGRGNNGGDGLVMARILSDRGVRVEVFLLADPDRVTGDAAINLGVVRRLGLPLTIVPDEAAFEAVIGRLSGFDLFIDAILGTGLNSEVRGVLRRVIDWLNERAAPVFAVDLPSGLDADTGRPLGAAVKAAATATFGLGKLGQFIHPGLDFVGRLAVVDIGIPPRVVAEADIKTELLDSQTVSRLLPARPPQGHKGTFGHVLVVGGSVGKTGAVCLAGAAAARIGAGLVTVAGPAGLNPIIEAKLTEVMSEPLAETTEGCLCGAAWPRVDELLRTRHALAWGPGMSPADEARELTWHMVQAAPRPAVIDADGLNHLAGGLARLRHAAGLFVLTPHPGEAARLLGTTGAAVQADRVAAARRLCQESGQVVVLKGARTLVAAPDGRLAVNPTGNVGLASGGSGDVLTGIIAGLLAQGLPSFEAASAGVFVHGLAADVAAEDGGARGMVAGDLLATIRGALLGLGASRINAPTGS